MEEVMKGTKFEDIQSDLPDTDLQQLLLRGFSRRVSRREVRHLGRAFTVVERRKGRRRFILWPQAVNDAVAAFGFKSEMSLQFPTEQIHYGSHAVCFDLTCSFWQCAIPVEMQPYFCFKVRNEYFAMTVMPMGTRTAPDVMQAIASGLAAHAVSVSGADVTFHVHVDNVRFIGDESEVVGVAAAFTQVCASVGATLNKEEVNAPHTRGDFLGVEFDYTAKTQWLADKTVQKVREAKQTFNDDNATIQDFASAYGILRYASRMLQVPLAQFYVPIKFARRRSADGYDPGKPAAVWQSAKPGFNKWCDHVIRNVPVSPPKTSPADVVLVTDASLTGWGAVLFTSDGAYHCAGGRWSEAHESGDMSVLETRAVRLAVAHFAELITGGSLKLCVDNTTTQQCLLKGFSASYTLNKEVEEALKEVANVSLKCFACAYVVSAENVADAQSRGREVDIIKVTELASSLGLQGGAQGRRKRNVSDGKVPMARNCPALASAIR